MCCPVNDYNVLAFSVGRQGTLASTAPALSLAELMKIKAKDVCISCGRNSEEHNSGDPTICKNFDPQKINQQLPFSKFLSVGFQDKVFRTVRCYIGVLPIIPGT